MGRINTSRVLAGGLLAGLVINIGEFLLNGPVAGDQFEAAMAESGMSMPGAGGTATFVVLAFVMGIVAVWLYAAMRPRYGAGPVTAFRAGAAAWFFSYAIPTIGYAVMGMVSGGLAALALVWGLVELPLATVIGAWVYREDEAPVPATAAPEAPEAPAASSRQPAPAGGAEGGAAPGAAGGVTAGGGSAPGQGSGGGTGAGGGPPSGGAPGGGGGFDR